MLAEVKTRLETRVPKLAGRIDGAAEFDRLVTSKQAPAAPMSAFLVPTGLQGQAPDVAAGIYRQPVRESFAVILVFRTNSATGDRALSEIRDRVMDVVHALCGWAPTGQPGGFQLLRAALLTFQRGTAFYQIDLAINDQLRITP